MKNNYKLSCFEMPYLIDGLQKEYEYHKTEYKALFECYKAFNRNGIDRMLYKRHFKACITILQLLDKIDVVVNDIAII